MEWLHQKCTLGVVTVTVFSFPSDTHHGDITHYISFTPPSRQQLWPEALCFFVCPPCLALSCETYQEHNGSSKRPLGFKDDPVTIWWSKVTVISQNTLNGIFCKVWQTDKNNRLSANLWQNDVLRKKKASELFSSPVLKNITVGYDCSSYWTFHETSNTTVAFSPKLWWFIALQGCHVAQVCDSYIE